MGDIMDIAAEAEDNIGKRVSVEPDFDPQLLDADTPIIEDRGSSKYSTRSSTRSRGDSYVSVRMERGSVSSQRSFAYKKEFGSSRKERGHKQTTLKRMWAWTKE